MNLYEYMGKEIFKKYSIPVPDGYKIDRVTDLNIKKELYLSITLDRSSKAPIIIMSTEGGMGKTFEFLLKR